MRELFRRNVGSNVWLSRAGASNEDLIEKLEVHEVRPEVFPDEESVGRAMLDELEATAKNKKGDIAIALLGGRG